MSLETPAAYAARDGKGVNNFSYTRETKKFILTLAFAFFSENLNFATGEQPPLAPEGWSSSEAAYDIVSMSWVQKKTPVSLESRPVPQTTN